MISALLAGFAAGAAVGAGIAVWRCSASRRRYGRFLSFTAHELNTPLTSMHMTSLNLVRGVFGPLPKEQQEWVVLLAEQTSRLAALVGDLRDFLHMEFHRDIHLQSEFFDLTEAVRESVEFQKGSMARSGAELTLKLPSGPLLVRADPDRLRRVVGNVLAHARKFRNAGAIEVTAESRPGRWVLSVLYKGPILAEGEAERMLSLFYPVDRPKSAVLSCVGMGLGACRELVERMGGRMRFDSDADGRSRIELELPADDGVR